MAEPSNSKTTKLAACAGKMGLKFGMNCIVPGSSCIVSFADAAWKYSQGDHQAARISMAAGALTLATLGVSDALEAASDLATLAVDVTSETIENTEVVTEVVAQTVDSVDVADAPEVAQATKDLVDFYLTVIQPFCMEMMEEMHDFLIEHGISENSYLYSVIMEPIPEFLETVNNYIGPDGVLFVHTLAVDITVQFAECADDLEKWWNKNKKMLKARKKRNFKGNSLKTTLFVTILKTMGLSELDCEGELDALDEEESQSSTDEEDEKDETNLKLRYKKKSKTNAYKQKKNGKGMKIEAEWNIQDDVNEGDEGDEVDSGWNIECKMEIESETKTKKNKKGKKNSKASKKKSDHEEMIAIEYEDFLSFSKTPCVHMEFEDDEEEGKEEVPDIEWNVVARQKDSAKVKGQRKTKPTARRRNSTSVSLRASATDVDWVNEEIFCHESDEEEADVPMTDGKHMHTLLRWVVAIYVDYVVDIYQALLSNKKKK